MTSVQDAALLSLKVYEVNGAAADESENPNANIAGFSAIDTSSFALSHYGQAEAIDFGAMAYQKGNDIVIVFRGTDNGLQDGINGYGTGAGLPSSNQSELAIAFYKAVKEAYPSHSLILTGHSLGGGLSGYIAGMFNETAVIFDNMDYDNAVMSAYNNLHEFMSWEQDVTVHGTESLYYDLYVGQRAYFEEFRAKTYGDGPVTEPNFSKITAHNVEGEFLTYTRSNSSQILSLGDGVALEPLYELHSMGLLNIRYFISSDNTLPQNIADVGRYIFPALLNAEVAHSLGFANYSETLESVAYSISAGGLPIRSFQNDAEDIFALASGIEAPAEFETYYENTLTLIARVAAQHTAYLAKGHASGAGLDPTGVLHFSSGQQTISIDFSIATWTAFGETPATMVGKADLLSEAVTDGIGLPPFEGFADYLSAYLHHESSDFIRKITIAVNADNGPITLEELEPGAYQAFIGSHAGDTVEGSDGNDLLFSGRALDGELVFDNDPDVLSGGLGNDMLVGGQSVDILIGGEGSDYIFGRDGDDIIHAGRAPTDEDGPFIDVGMGEEFSPLTLDTETDVIAAGGGDDTIYISGVGDIISAGDGDDHIYIERSTATAFMPSTTAIWGGAGADTYHINTNCNVLFVYCDVLTEEMFLNLDVSKLYSDMSQYFSLDYIIFNPESSDRLYVGNELISDISIHSNTLVSHTEEFYEYTLSGETLEGRQIEIPTQVAYYDTTTTTRTYTHDGSGDGLTVLTHTSSGYQSDPSTGVTFDNELVNRLSIQYPQHEGKVFFSGYTAGTLGTSFAGNAPSGTTNASYALYNINVTDWGDVERSGSNYQAIDLTYSLEDLIESDSGTTNGVDLRSTYFDQAGQVHLDISKYQLSDSSSGNDEGAGDDRPDLYHGGGGNDSYAGNGGVDEIHGGSGDDNLSGGDDTDFIEGGTGDDAVAGGADNDYYFYNSGDGADVVTELDGEGDGDQIVLVDVNPERVSLYRVDSDDLKIVIAESSPGANDGGSILVKRGLDVSTELGVEALQFANGTIWSKSYFVANSVEEIEVPAEATVVGTSGADSLEGTWEEDVFYGGLGDDVLTGSAGSDVYLYSSTDGSDQIDDLVGFTTDLDVLRLNDLNADDLALSRDDYALKITIVPTGQVLTFNGQYWNDTDHFGIDKIEFADGSSWDRATLLAMVDTPIATVIGTSGADNLEGTWEEDVFHGGLGDDILNGSAGSDIYLYSSGDGSDQIDELVGFTTDLDVLRLSDLNADDIALSRDGDALKITIVPTGHVLTFNGQYWNDTDHFGIDKIEFADGSSWDRTTLLAMVDVPVATVIGTSGADNLEGTWEDDVFYGGLGDDVLNGSAGSDIYLYSSGDGNDQIDELVGFTDNLDVLRLGDLNADDIVLSRNDAALEVRIVPTDEVLTFNGQYWNYTDHFGIDKIEFADGSSWDRAQILDAAWIRGTNGNDVLSGFASQDTLEGGAGNDELTGDAGSDAFVFKPNFGLDIVHDFVAGAGSEDVLEFASVLFADFEAVLAAAAVSGDDTLITVDSGNVITLKNVALSSLHQDDFRFVA